MIELLWLLLPVAAASGWFAARRSLLAQIREKQARLSPYYFKGLNYLFNEEPDKAIDAFIKLIEVDSDTVETHLALGSLFRRRGEVNRAIRIHQNLIARSTLSPQQRSLAILELGQDYRRAGLFDRAETLFQELATAEEHRVYAYRQLLDIYQQEQDWEQAITTALQLADVSGQTMNGVIAQYRCEEAEAYRRQGQWQAAFAAITHALTIDPNCVRASLLEGQLSLDTKNVFQAIKAFKRVEEQNPDYLPEIIEPLQKCYQKAGQLGEFSAYLTHILQRYGGITVMLTLANLISQAQGEREAADFIVKQLHKRPSIRGLDYLLELALANTGGLTRDHLLLLKDMTGQLLRNKPVYKCSHCGFKGKSLHWQCPSCKQWNTVKPIQGIEGE